MKVWQLEEVFRLLMAEGKGDYDVVISPTLFEDKVMDEVDVNNETKTVTL